MKLAGALVVTISLCFQIFGQETASKPVHLSPQKMKKKVLSRDFPDVPPEVRNFHARVGINVLVDVDKSGTATKVYVLGWRNLKFLSDYLEATISKWRFKRVKVDGQPQHYRGVVTIAFCYGAFYEKSPC